MNLIFSQVLYGKRSSNEARDRLTFDKARSLVEEEMRLEEKELSKKAAGADRIAEMNASKNSKSGPQSSRSSSSVKEEIAQEEFEYEDDFDEDAEEDIVTQMSN